MKGVNIQGEGEFPTSRGIRGNSEPGFEGRFPRGNLTVGVAGGDAQGKYRGNTAFVQGAASGPGWLFGVSRWGSRAESLSGRLQIPIRGVGTLLLGSGVSKCDSWAVVSRSRGGRCP